MNIDKLLAEIEQNSGYVPVTVAEVVRFAQLVRAADEMANSYDEFQKATHWGMSDFELKALKKIDHNRDNYRKLREGGGT